MRNAGDAVAPVAIDRRATLVLIGCTIGLLLNVTTLFNGTVTAFIKPMSTEFGWSRGELSLGLSIAMLPLLLFLPWVGHFSDRVGPRRVIAFGAPVFALALASLAWLPPVYPLYLFCCALVGTAGVFTYNTLYYALLARWFDRRLGLALGVASAGTGVGLSLGPIAAQALIADMGWRKTYVAFAIVSIVTVLPSSLLLLRDSPHRAVVAGAATGAGLGPALRSFRLWRLALAYSLTGLAISGTGVHLMPLLTDRGMTAPAAAMIASYVGMSVLAARMISGLVLDYVDSGLWGAACFIFAAAGIGMLAIPLSEPLTIVAAVLIGVALGAEGGVLGYVTRRVFGTAGYGAILAMISSMFLAGVLLGPLIGGASFDRFGSYQPAMVAFAVVCVLAAALHAGVTRAAAAEVARRDALSKAALAHTDTASS
jgi:MFS family permease